MDLSIKSQTYGADDSSWIASRHGLNNARTITLDVSAFTKADHYPEGFLMSGLPLAKLTATNKYVPYTSAAADEVQEVEVTGGPTGGTFTLTFSGQTTAGIAFNAAPSAVQAALEALSNIAPGDVVVSGVAGAYEVTFGGAYAGDNVAQMTASGASLTGGTSPGVTVTTTTAGGSVGGAGSEVLVGHLLGQVHVPDDLTKDVGGALFWHGVIEAAHLPKPVDADGRTAVAGRILYV